jgi:solute carrier family 25 protein 39/40
MLKETWRVNQQSERISAGQEGCQALINGMVSGFIASVLTQPMDVIKTRRQLQLDTEPLGKAASCNHSGALVYRQTREAGTLEIFQKIIAEEGPKGLWKGYVPRTLKVSPACAIMLGSYEIGKRMLSD